MFGIMVALALDSALPVGQTYRDLPPEVVLSSTPDSIREGYAIGQILHVTRVSDDPLEVEIRSIRWGVGAPLCDYRDADCVPEVGALMRISPSLESEVVVMGNYRPSDQIPLNELALALGRSDLPVSQDGHSWYVGEALRFEEMSLQQAAVAWELIELTSLSVAQIGDCVPHQLADIYHERQDDPAAREMLDAIAVMTDLGRERDFGARNPTQMTPAALTEIAVRMLAQDETVPEDAAALLAMAPFDRFAANDENVKETLTANFDRIIRASRYMRRFAG